MVLFRERRLIGGSLHFWLEAELILHQLGHLARQGVILLCACSWRVSWVWEGVKHSIVAHFMITAAVQIPLQPVGCRSNPPAGIKWGPRRAER
jgi:hypothetical protein